jgi:hypothetical protein
MSEVRITAGVPDEAPLVVPVPAIWLANRSMREYQAMLRPQLAANDTGVWVRTGVGGAAEELGRQLTPSLRR